MTDDEKAKQYAIGRTYPRFESDYIANFVLREVEGAYLAGLKADRPRWHDLRKDPNDLPNDDRVVSEQKGENVRYVKHRNKWFYLDRTGEANVIAWCETPKYTEE